MLECKFYLNPNPDFRGRPTFSFLNMDESEKYWMLYELQWCDHEYFIHDVILGLEKVNSGELGSYEFGYDATIIEYKPKESTIYYNFGDNTIQIDSTTIYHFIRDWVNYLLSLLDQDFKPASLQ